jgi:hypothetical protein
VRVAGVVLGTLLGAGAGLALEMALNAGFKTGVGPGLDMGARRMGGGVVRFYTCVPRTVCTAGDSEGFVEADLFL